MGNSTTVFKTVFDSTPLNDGLYFFLQVVYRHYPEDEFHLMLAMATKDKKEDDEIYKEAQRKLPEIKPFMAKFTYVLPGLKKLKKEMALQTLQLLGDWKELHGALEIGSAGGFVNHLGKKIKLKGERYVMNDAAPANTLAGMLERDSLFRPGRFLPLTYEPILPEDIPSESLGLVACYTGLHHCPQPLITGFVASVHQVLRKGGIFILREHDVHTPLLETLVAFAHTVINLGSNIPWAEHVNKTACFMPVNAWSEMITAAGFTDSGARLLQKGDPTHNTLMMFVKL